MVRTIIGYTTLAVQTIIPSPSLYAPRYVFNLPSFGQIWGLLFATVLSSCGVSHCNFCCAGSLLLIYIKRSDCCLLTPIFLHAGRDTIQSYIRLCMQKGKAGLRMSGSDLFTVRVFTMSTAKDETDDHLMWVIADHRGHPGPSTHGQGAPRCQTATFPA